MSITSYFKRFFQKRKIPAGHYNIKVVSLPEGLTYYSELPKELVYALEKEPEIKNKMVRFLECFGLGLRTIEKTPELILEAVNNIAIISQHKTITTWLIPLLTEGKRPVFSSDDYKIALEKKINLDKLVDIIYVRRFDFKQFILLDESSNVDPFSNIQLEHFIEIETDDESFSEKQLEEIKKEGVAVVSKLNKTIEEISLKYAINRIVFDNAHTRTAAAQSIIKALLLVGPITHLLEKFIQGVGKVFAASVDDILSETAELVALRGSGFTWKVVFFKRLKILLPVFILSTYAAFHVETLIQMEMYSIAGLVFGISAVSLSLTTAIQSINIYKKCIDELILEKKINDTKNRFKMAVIQDFTNPARLGLFCGAIASPIVSFLVFQFFQELLHNGWVLALLGSTETIVASATVMLSKHLNDKRYTSFLVKEIRKLRNNKN